MHGVHCNMKWYNSKDKRYTYQELMDLTEGESYIVDKVMSDILDYMIMGDFDQANMWLGMFIEMYDPIDMYDPIIGPKELCHGDLCDC
jgi:hypothetical protein